jgi:hypothetical protein
VWCKNRCQKNSFFRENASQNGASVVSFSLQVSSRISVFHDFCVFFMIFVISGNYSLPRRLSDLISHDFETLLGDFHDFGHHFGAVASLAVYRTPRLQDDSRISFFRILDLLWMILHPTRRFVYFFLNTYRKKVCAIKLCIWCPTWLYSTPPGLAPTS